MTDPRGRALRRSPSFIFARRGAVCLPWVVIPGRRPTDVLIRGSLFELSEYGRGCAGLPCNEHPSVEAARTREEQKKCMNSARIWANTVDWQDSRLAAIGSQSFSMTASEMLKVRVSPKVKMRFAELANAEEVTESTLLRRLVDAVIEREAGARRSDSGSRAAGIDGRPERVMVRMRPGDKELLQRRAVARGLKAATYLAVLARSHLRSVTPLPTEELAALRRAVAELSAVGRNLNQIARTANLNGSIDAPLRVNLHAVLLACERLRDDTKSVIKANFISWGADHGDAQ